jgi:hypothetical protein
MKIAREVCCIPDWSLGAVGRDSCGAWRAPVACPLDCTWYVLKNRIESNGQPRCRRLLSLSVVSDLPSYRYEGWMRRVEK